MMKSQTVLLALILASFACNAESSDPADPADPAGAPTRAEPPAILIEQALLADLLGEAVEVDEIWTRADGLLVRLAFEPLIRQTGPVQLQLVQSTGYRLLGVAEGAPLWQLGLRDGDVLTSVDHEPIIGREHDLRSEWERRPARVEIGYQRDGQERMLALRIRPGAAWRSASSSSDLADSEGLTPAPEVVGVRCAPGDTADSIGRCEIERETMDRLIEDPAAFARQGRIVPTTRDDGTEGFKLFGIRRGSLASQLGIKNGDTLLALDGALLSNPEAALAAFARVPKLGTFTLTLERRGATQQLTISIVEMLK